MSWSKKRFNQIAKKEGLDKNYAKHQAKALIKELNSPYISVPYIEEKCRKIKEFMEDIERAEKRQTKLKKVL